MPLVEIPFFGREMLARLILSGVFGGAIWVALYHYIRKGSSAARITLTIFAGLGVLTLGATWFLVIRIPVLALAYGIGIFARAAIVILVNSEPIKTIAPEVPAAKCTLKAVRLR